MILYECDPTKNKRCRKTCCGWEKTGIKQCYITSKKKYAKLDEYGNPIIRYMDNLGGKEEK